MFKPILGGLVALNLIASAAAAAHVRGEFKNPLDIKATDFHYYVAGKGVGVELPITAFTNGKPAFEVGEVTAGDGGVEVGLVERPGTSSGVAPGGTVVIRFTANPAGFTLPLDRVFFTYANHAPVLAPGSWVISDVPIPEAPVPAAGVIGLSGLAALLAARGLRRRAAVA